MKSTQSPEKQIDLLKSAWYVRYIIAVVALCISAYLFEVGLQKLDNESILKSYLILAIAATTVISVGFIAWEASVVLLVIALIVLIFNILSSLTKTETLIVIAWVTLAGMIYTTRK